MNRILSIFALCTVAASSAFADSPIAPQTVILDRKEVTVSQNPVVIARTAATPKKVFVTLPVKMSATQCVRYDTRIVFGRDASCGYDTIIRRVCNSSGYQNCRRICNNGYCRTVCSSGPGNCYFTRDLVMRSCSYPQSYCSQTGIVNSVAYKTVKLKFKNLPELSGEQMDTFKISANQRSMNNDFTLYDLQSESTIGQYQIDVRQNAEKIVISR